MFSQATNLHYRGNSRLRGTEFNLIRRNISILCILNDTDELCMEYLSSHPYKCKFGSVSFRELLVTVDELASEFIERYSSRKLY